MLPELRLSDRIPQTSPNQWESRSLPHCAGITITSEDERLVVEMDLKRTRPIFYRSDSSRVVISDDPYRLIDDETPLAAEGIADFRDFGIALGERTLIRGLRQLRAGSRNIWTATGGPEPQVTLDAAAFSCGNCDDETELTERLIAAFNAEMTRLVASADGRQLALPLSGGLDSRLLLTWLAEHKYPNLLAFTYGRPGTAEAQISREVAGRLQVPWQFVDYTSESISQRWLAPETAEWIKYAASASSLPHMQDFAAIGELRERGVITPEAIILAGHTVVGNAHDEWLLDAADRPVELIGKVIAKHHGSQRSNLGLPLTSLRAISSYLADFGYDGTDHGVIDALSGFNLLERQPKYINHSMRTYEWYGLDWALPMLEPELISAWNFGSPRLVADRTVYKQWISNYYAAVTQTEPVPYFTPMKSSQSARDRVRKVLRQLGVENLAQRSLTTRASLRSGVAMDLFVTGWSRAKISQSIFFGKTLTGIYAEQFLADEWNPASRLFTGRPIDDTDPGDSHFLIEPAK